MAQIMRFPFVRYLQSDPSEYVLHHRNGKLVHGGRGLAFWFTTLSASVAEVPCNDRELEFLFHSRTKDFQDVTTQGVVVWRASDPEKLATHVDFSIDPVDGSWRRAPLERIGNLLSQIAQQLAGEYVTRTTVRGVLAEGAVRIREEILKGLAAHPLLAEMGLATVAVRVTAVSPAPELEKVLQMPAREAIQQEADEALFQRRALVIEKERAIQEKELENRVEAARRQQVLLEQDAQNGRKAARELAEAETLAAEAAAARRRLESTSSADSIRIVQEARIAAEKSRMEVYRDLPVGVLLALAARRLAGKLRRIDHLNIAPEMLVPALAELAATPRNHVPTNGDGLRVS